MQSLAAPLYEASNGALRRHWLQKFQAGLSYLNQSGSYPLVRQLLHLRRGSVENLAEKFQGSVNVFDGYAHVVYVIDCASLSRHA